jgi:hypothetical protein
MIEALLSLVVLFGGWQDRVQFARCTPSTTKTLSMVPGEVVLDQDSESAWSLPEDVRVRRFAVKPGQSVTPGTLLSELDVPAMTALVVRLQALEEELSVAQGVLQTSKERLQLGFAAQVEVQQAQGHLHALEASISEYRQRLAFWQSLGLSQTAEGWWEWRSAHAATIQSQEVLSATQVPAGDALLVVYQEDPRLLLKVALPEKYTDYIDASLRVDWSPSGYVSQKQRIQAPLAFFEPRVDPTSRTIACFFDLSGLVSKHIIPGRTGRALIQVDLTHPVWRVPSSALVSLEGKDVLFVAQADDSLPRPTAVEVLSRQADEALIDGPGITAETEIAIQGLFLLKSLTLLSQE